MKLYLVRHGIATHKIGGAVLSDRERPLTPNGRIETTQVARGLKALGVQANLLVTSPLIRALQTAEIFAEVFSYQNQIEVTEALAPGGNASDLYKVLRQFADGSDVFLFGHEPDLSRLAATLLWAGSELDISFKKAGICRIDIVSVPPTSPATLKWLLTPKILSLLAPL